MVHEEAQTLNLLEKNFKLSILNVWKELKETISRKLMESMRMMSHLVENIKKKKLLEKPNRNLELKSTVLKYKVHYKSF